MPPPAHLIGEDQGAPRPMGLARQAMLVGLDNLEGPWKNCMDQFLNAPGFDAAAFIATAKSIQWLDSRGAYGGLKIQSSGELFTRRDFVGSAEARVIRDADGVQTNQVVIGASWYGSWFSSPDRAAIAVHEALHVYLKLDDSRLKGWLEGNTGFQAGFGGELGTYDISLYVAKGCPAPASGGTSP